MGTEVLVAGVDEVGRGPFAGPVCAAAVILPKVYDLPYLTDSKRLSAKRRLALSGMIKKQSIAWSIAYATVVEIDQINILQATYLAMRRAVQGLTTQPGLILVDGRSVPHFGIAAKPIVGGDGLEACISAASVIAKVARDALMAQLDLCYPDYGLAQHMGYGTKQHRDALQARGVSAAHRRSFAPIAALACE